ncbi:Seven TM Receptor [Aphelenchoides bicaudatus]|nr:Seven TM Receptor [Aphelenchoides bicaudatus]
MSENKNDIYRFPFLVNSVCAAGLGFTMNMLLLFLITKRTPSVMKSYSRIMKIHCLSDVAYDSVCFITGLHPTPIAGHVFCLWQGFITKVPLWLNHILFSCWYWVLLTAVTLLPVDFYFRYMSVCHNKDLTNRQIAIMVFCAYFVTWLHTFPNSYNYMVFSDTPEAAEYTKELERFEQWKGNVPSYAATILGGSKAVANYLYVILLNVVCYSIIGYTSYQINKALKQNANVNKNTKSMELQKQVSRILILQFTLPLTVVSIPMSVIAVLGLMKVDVPYAGAFSSATYYWLSAVKPIATILIVRSYREYAIRKILRPLFCIHPQHGNKISSITANSVVHDTPMDSSSAAY